MKNKTINIAGIDISVEGTEISFEGFYNPPIISGIDGEEIICPFCNTPQQTTTKFKKTRIICKSCDKMFEVQKE